MFYEINSRVREPRKEYEKTRHNIGFVMIDALAKHNSVNLSKKNLMVFMENIYIIMKKLFF